MAKTVEERIEGMAKWASGMQVQVAELQARFLPSIEQMDAISAELGALCEEQAQINSLLGESEKRRSELIAYDDEMEVVEAEVSLDVACALNEMGKARYPNESARAMATKIALNGNRRYQELLAEKRARELELASMRAVSEELERQLSLGRGRARALVARLENLTARIRAN